MIAEIDGSRIRSESDFHVAIALALGLPHHYGRNLDALWDILSSDVERPVQLIWNRSALSQVEMPVEFDLIVSLLHKVERQDADWNLPEEERFRLVLR